MRLGGCRPAWREPPARSTATLPSRSTDVRDFDLALGDGFHAALGDARRYDLAKLSSVDLVLAVTGDGPKLAHTIVSFGFDYSDQVCRLLGRDPAPVRRRASQAIGGFFPRIRSNT